MTRYLYGVTGGDVIAQVSLDPTTADPAHKDFGPIAGAVEIWSYDRAVRETDLLSVDLGTLTPGAAITAAAADGSGRIPFLGKDEYRGAYWGKATDGAAAVSWYLLLPADLANRASAANVTKVIWAGDGTQPTRPGGLPADGVVHWQQPSAPPIGDAFAHTGDEWLATG